MKTFIKIYDDIVARVTVFYKQMQLHKLEKRTGRPLALSIIETIALGIFKQQNGIPTKKRIHKIFNLRCSYKTLVVNLNRFVLLAARILAVIMNHNNATSHIVKHTDSTDIPVCLKRNGKHHKTMKGLAH